MNRNNALFGLCLFILGLSGCASLSQPVAETNVKLSVSGQAKILNNPRQSALQRRYQAEQQAAINAYRRLAALLFQQIVKPDVSVADQVLQNEMFRLYVDTFLREAEIHRDTNRNYSHVELNLTIHNRFRRCMSNLAAVQNCLREENKIPFSRIGYREAMQKFVNLHCQVPDCSGQFSIAGFRRENSVVNKALLHAGLYDVEWLLNTTAQIAARYFLLTEFPPR
jgi:hypothetical protein